MTEAIHKNLSDGRWQLMTLSEQMANVGSEFSRMYRAREENKEARFISATKRFLELINLTICDPRWSGRRRRELTRLKETVLDSLYPSKFKLKDVKSLEKYFFYFGFVARSTRLN